LRKERNNALHEYEWTAYEMWLGQEGATQPARISLLSVRPEDMQSVLIMKGGHYKNHNSLELLKDSAEWIQARIFGAICRAGYDPEEDRRIGDFQKRPPTEDSLLGSWPDTPDGM
jgi:hypothetical protein